MKLGGCKEPRWVLTIEDPPKLWFHFGFQKKKNHPNRVPSLNKKTRPLVFPHPIPNSGGVRLSLARSIRGSRSSSAVLSQTASFPVLHNEGIRSPVSSNHFRVHVSSFWQEKRKGKEKRIGFSLETNLEKTHPGPKSCCQQEGLPQICASTGPAQR